MNMIKHSLTKKLLPLAIILGTTTYHTQSNAYEAGDFILRAGLASVQPDESPFGTLKPLMLVLMTPKHWASPLATCSPSTLHLVY